MTNNTLIFLHIPKTAGSTFHDFLNRLYPRDQILNVNGGSFKSESIRNFINTDISLKHNIKLLKGHMPFGLHDYLPGDARYITFLRDPVKRVVSAFNYIKANPKNPRYELVKKYQFSISDFIESGYSFGMNNAQVRCLLGGIDNITFGKVTDDHYEKAINNLQCHFDAIGITENFLDSIALFSYKLNWNNLPDIMRGVFDKCKKVISPGLRSSLSSC